MARSVTTYQALLAAAQEQGFVSEHVEDLLEQAATAIDEDPRNDDNDTDGAYDPHGGEKHRYYEEN